MKLLKNMYAFQCHKACSSACEELGGSLVENEDSSQYKKHLTNVETQEKSECELESISIDESAGIEFKRFGVAEP